MAQQRLRIVIVGGVAGGASAAARARRMNEAAEIILLEKDEHVSFANCGLPYYIGQEIGQRGQLLVAPAELLRRRFRIDVRCRHEATAIDRQAKQLTVVDHATGQPYQQPYDKLILAPGASPAVPPIPGHDAHGVFTLRNLADTDRIKAAVDNSRKKQAVVVGAGYLGLEMVEQLVRRGLQTALAELEPQVLPLLDPEMARPIQQQLIAHGVDVHLGDGIRRVLTGADNCAEGVELQSGAVLSGDVVILAVGVRPNIQLAEQAGLTIGPSGGIATNAYMQTSDPDIYAVGDAAEYVFGPTGQALCVPLAGPANRAGRLAGEHAATGRGRPMAPVLGTSIVRVFDQTAALTGLTTKSAGRLGVPSRSVTIIAPDHARYYPGAQPMTIKLLYGPEDGKVLGAQVVGGRGVDKRIDVIATAMALGATVGDLAGLDLAYAPPFGAAKDPVHLAAFAACNQLDGIADVAPADIDLRDKQVVDVRTAAEVERQPLAGAEGAIHIPLDDLREQLGRLDPSRETIVSCAAGLRAHVAARILRQHGFQDVKNLSGGATVRNRAWPKRQG